MTASERIANDFDRALSIIEAQSRQVTPSCLSLRDVAHEVRSIKSDVAHQMELAGQREAKLREALRDVYDSLEGYIDGAPDASALSKLANGICRDIKEALNESL